MIDTTFDLDTALLGPRGGKIDKRYNLEAKQTHAQVALTGDGEIGLHRFNPSVPTTGQGIENERPWHRIAAYMLATTSATQKEVAAAAGVTESHVSKLNQQLWFQELKATFAAHAGRTITERFQAEAFKSLDRLVELRDDTDRDDNGKPIVPAAVKANVSQFIIDHHIGKAVQKTISVTASHNFSSEDEERAFILSELNALREAGNSAASATSGAEGHDETNPSLRAEGSNNPTTTPESADGNSAF